MRFGTQRLQLSSGHKTCCTHSCMTNRPRFASILSNHPRLPRLSLGLLFKTCTNSSRVDLDRRGLPQRLLHPVHIGHRLVPGLPQPRGACGSGGCVRAARRARGVLPTATHGAAHAVLQLSCTDMLAARVAPCLRPHGRCMTRRCAAGSTARNLARTPPACPLMPTRSCPTRRRWPTRAPAPRPGTPRCRSWRLPRRRP